MVLWLLCNLGKVFGMGQGWVKNVVSEDTENGLGPEEVINKQVSFLANLAPRPMMGMILEGMILMAEDQDGSLAFVQPGKVVWNGAGVN